MNNKIVGEILTHAKPMLVLSTRNPEEHRTRAVLTGGLGKPGLFMSGTSDKMPFNGKATTVRFRRWLPFERGADHETIIGVPTTGERSPFERGG